MRNRLAALVEALLQPVSDTSDKLRQRRKGQQDGRRQEEQNCVEPERQKPKSQQPQAKGAADEKQPPCKPLQPQSATTVQTRLHSAHSRAKQHHRMRRWLKASRQAIEHQFNQQSEAHDCGVEKKKAQNGHHGARDTARAALCRVKVG